MELLCSLRLNPMGWEELQGSTQELFKYHDHSRKVLKSRFSDGQGKEVIGIKGRVVLIGTGYMIKYSKFIFQISKE